MSTVISMHPFTVCRPPLQREREGTATSYAVSLEPGRVRSRSHCSISMYYRNLIESCRSAARLLTVLYLVNNGKFFRAWELKNTPVRVPWFLPMGLTVSSTESISCTSRCCSTATWSYTIEHSSWTWWRVESRRITVKDLSTLDLASEIEKSSWVTVP